MKIKCNHCGEVSNSIGEHADHDCPGQVDGLSEAEQPCRNTCTVYGAELGWKDSLPDEQGYWWWWNYDGAPVPVSIMFSGTDNSYFATQGQFGWTRAQLVKDMGGMWMRLPEPETP